MDNTPSGEEGLSVLCIVQAYQFSLRSRLCKPKRLKLHFTFYFLFLFSLPLASLEFCPEGYRNLYLCLPGIKNA
jgi:hypothetical protein